jgi:kumamolisin
MSSSTSSDSILVDFPESLNPDQIQAFPSYTSITTPPLLTAPKIATAYNIPAGNGSGVKVGIISLGGGFSQTDLNMSMANLGLTTGNVTFVGVDGATNTPVTGSTADQENALDLVCVAGMVPSANIVLYKGLNSGVYFSSNANTANALNSNSSFGNAIQRAVDDNCDVITISWGIYEQRTIANVVSYCGNFLNAPLANAAAKNISVFVASGDYGSAGTSNATIGMSVDYPASNSNVTAVGGTYLTLTGGNTRSAETVYNNSEAGLPGVGGSGGVSSITSLPTYQANLTYKTYPGNSVSTLTTRGVPDISAAMNAYGVWVGNIVQAISGTSASAPIMAGMVARFISLNGGRRPISGSSGLNKSFYQNTGSFYDITTGNNASLLATGYSATVGWDAAVGLSSQANATQTYQSVTTAGLRVKTASSTWSPVQNISIKTAANTWTTVNRVWTKTASGWVQTY